MNEVKERYKNICRACMNKNNKMRKIFNSEVNSIPVSQMLSFATPINVRPDDGLPSSICYICLNNLIGAYKFQQMCIDSDLQMRLELKKFETYDVNNIDSRIRSISPNILDNIQSGVTEGIPIDSDEDDYDFHDNNVEDHHHNSSNNDDHDDDDDDVIVISSTIDSLLKNKRNNIENASNQSKPIESTSLTGTDFVLKLENNDSEYDKQEMRSLTKESCSTSDNNKQIENQETPKNTFAETKKSTENNWNESASSNISNFSKSNKSNIQQNSKQQQIARITNAISLAPQPEQKSPQEQLKLQFNSLNKETDVVQSFIQNAISKHQSPLSSINRLQVRNTIAMMAKTTTSPSSMLQTPVAVTTIAPMSTTILTYSRKPSMSSTRQQDTPIADGKQRQQNKDNDLQTKIVAYVCSVCRVVFSEKENFVRHKKFHCPREKSQETTKSSQTSFLRTTTNISPSSSLQTSPTSLPSTSTGLSNLDKSKKMTTIQSHMNDNLNYRCTECLKLYKSKIDFHQHLIVDHSTKQYKPGLNQYLIKGNIVVDCTPLHEKEKNSITDSSPAKIKTFICYICKQDCINLKGLNKHLLEHKKTAISSSITKITQSSDNINKSTNTSLIKKCYACSVCKKLCGSLDEYGQHVKEHKIITNKYQCNFCTKKFNTSSELNTHLNNHKVNLVYDTNDKKKNPTVHISVDVNELLKCDLCKKGFSTQEEILWHLLEHEHNYSNSTRIARLLKCVDNENIGTSQNNQQQNQRIIQLQRQQIQEQQQQRQIQLQRQQIQEQQQQRQIQLQRQQIQEQQQQRQIQLQRQQIQEQQQQQPQKRINVSPQNHYNRETQLESMNLEPQTVANNSNTNSTVTTSSSSPTTKTTTTTAASTTVAAKKSSNFEEKIEISDDDDCRIKIKKEKPDEEELAKSTTTAKSENQNNLRLSLPTQVPKQTSENFNNYDQEFISVDNNLSDTFINEGEEDMIEIKNVTLLSNQSSSSQISDIAPRDESDFPFMCTLCDKGFQNKHQANNHCTNTHRMSSNFSRIIVELPRIDLNEINIFECDYCTESFIDRSEQLGHVRLKHSKDYKLFVIKLIDSQEKDIEENSLLNYNCYFCGVEHNDKNSLLEHLKIHRINFNSNASSSQNRNSPTGDEIGSKIRCELCSKQFHKKNLKYHLMSVHSKRNSGKLLKSNITRSQVDNEKLTYQNDSNNLKDNMDNKNKIIKIKSEYEFDNNCPMCFKDFPNTHILKRHIRVVHIARGDILKENLIMDDIEKHGIQFHCDQCTMILHSYKSLKRHKKVNHDDKKQTESQWYQCGTCNKKFLLKSNYESHRKLHESATRNHHVQKEENKNNKDSKKPELIEINSNSFSDVTSTDGTESQIDERSTPRKQINNESYLPGYSDPHRCLYCRKIFGNRSSFVKHLNKLHEKCLTKKLPQSDKVHQCQICTRIVSTHIKLREHMTRHIPDSKKSTIVKSPIQSSSSVESPFTVKNEIESVSDSTIENKKKTKFDYKTSCKICKKSYVMPGHLKRHLMIDHKINDLKCDKYITLLNRPNKISQKPIKCKLCSKKLYSNAGYSKHLKLFCTKRNKKNLIKQTQLNDNKCKYCDNSYVKEVDLRRHVIMKHRKLLQEIAEKMRSNNDVNLQSPPNKKTKLERRNTMSTTNETMKSSSSSSSSSSTSVELLMCRICGRKFIRKDFFGKHQESHEKGYKNLGKMFIRCKICNKYLKEDSTLYHFEIYHAFDSEIIKNGKYKNHLEMREVITRNELNCNTKSKDKTILQRRKSVHQIETTRPLSPPLTSAIDQRNPNKRMTRRNTIMVDARETNTFLCLEDIVKPKRRKSVGLNVNSERNETKENSNNLEEDSSYVPKVIALEKMKITENNTTSKFETYKTAEFKKPGEKIDNLDDMKSVGLAAFTEVKQFEFEENVNQNDKEKNNVKFVKDFENVTLETDVNDVDQEINRKQEQNDDQIIKETEKNVDETEEHEKKENTNVRKKNDSESSTKNECEKIGEIFDNSKSLKINDEESKNIKENIEESNEKIDELENDIEFNKNFDEFRKETTAHDDEKKLNNHKEILKVENKQEDNDNKSISDTLNILTNTVKTMEYEMQESDYKKFQQNEIDEDEKLELHLSSSSSEIEMEID